MGPSFEVMDSMVPLFSNASSRPFHSKLVILRNPNIEIRNSKQIRMSENPMAQIELSGKMYLDRGGFSMLALPFRLEAAPPREGLP